ncbi:MAG: hypothetical protein IIY87_01600 [Bacteroidales bacterium]|nr:hypothetical protein [Bacteroidales bacterium]
MMDKSTFNVKLDNLCCYSMTDKSEIQAEKNRFPFCTLLQVMDILSDKATNTSRWEERFLPKMALYLTDSDKFVSYLNNVSLTEIQTASDIKTKQQVEQAKKQEFDPADNASFDIMKEINAYQEVSFKTAPKSVILSKFLETGNYKPEDLGNSPSVSVEDLGKKSIQQDDSLNTETMAVVFEKQGRFDRAIAIYEKLITRFPEKSSTFAIRISELKMKLENASK